MKKTWVYVIIGVVLIAVVYFMFFRNKATAKTTEKEVVDLGFTKSGKAITESMVTTEMRSIESYNRQLIQQKATDAGRTYQEQLRLDAIYMLQNATGH